MEYRDLSNEEMRNINGGITPFAAVLVVGGVIGVAKTVSYVAGYIHGWIDKQIDRLRDD